MSNLPLNQVQLKFTGWTQTIPRPIWILIIGGLINSSGGSLLWPLNSLYIHDVLGRSLTTAGIVLMLMNAAGIVGNLLGGALFDRLGGKPVILTGLLGSSMMVATIGLAHNWYVYVGGMMVLGLLQSAVWPAMNAFVGQLWPEGGRRAFNILYVTNNAGVAIGTALGGLVASYSFTLVFILNAITFFIYTIFLMFGVKTPVKQSSDLILTSNRAVKIGIPTESRSIWHDWIPLSTLAIGILLTWAAYSQWQGTVAVYTQQLGYPLSAYSLLWTINGFLIVAAQPILIPFLRRFLASIPSQILFGAGLYAIAFVLIACWPTYLGFIFGMIVITIGEMVLLPGVPAAVNQIAPSSKVGSYQGFIGSASTAGRMFGPVLGGWVYDHGTAVQLFVYASIACVIAYLVFLGYASWYKQSQMKTL